MWSSYNNALVKLNSDVQKSREVTCTMRSIMTSISKSLRLGMFPSDADPFPVCYISFEIIPWQKHGEISCLRMHQRKQQLYSLKDNSEHKFKVRQKCMIGFTKDLHMVLMCLCWKHMPQVHDCTNPSMKIHVGNAYFVCIPTLFQW